MDINYNERMLGYYPEIIKAIREFRDLIETQSVQIDELHRHLVNILNNAYLSTADEEQLDAWEKLLEIPPTPYLNDSPYEEWLNQRRGQIIAKLFLREKLNTKTIENIVRTMCGGWAESNFKDGVLSVYVTPGTPKEMSFIERNSIRRIIREKLPAHLNLWLEQEFYKWLSVKNSGMTWGDVKRNYKSWADLKVDSEHYRESESV